jgi:hypothetical protein
MKIRTHLFNLVSRALGLGLTKHTGNRVGVKVNKAVSTQGFKLEVAPPIVGAGPLVWTEVSQITDIPDPSGTTSDLDATNLASTQKEYINGLQDSSAITMTGQRVATDAGQNIVRDGVGLAPYNFRNTYSDGAILTYMATIKKFGVTGGTDAVQMMTISIRATGAETWSGTGAPAGGGA